MGLDFSELIVILLIILVLFGPTNLPEIGKAIGQAIKEFKKALKESDNVDKAKQNENSQNNKTNSN